MSRPTDDEHQNTERTDGAHDTLRQELLELLFDCHPNPEPLQERIENEPQVCALFDETKRLAGVLHDAAKDAPQESEHAVLAESLARRGDLLDGLIDASAYDLVGSVEQIAERLAREEPGDDYQQRLDAVRFGAARAVEVLPPEVPFGGKVAALC